MFCTLLFCILMITGCENAPKHGQNDDLKEETKASSRTICFCGRGKEPASWTRREKYGGDIFTETDRDAGYPKSIWGEAYPMVYKTKGKFGNRNKKYVDWLWKDGLGVHQKKLLQGRMMMHPVFTKLLILHKKYYNTKLLIGKIKNNFSRIYYSNVKILYNHL